MVRFTTPARNHITGIILEVFEYVHPPHGYRILDSLGKIDTWYDYHFAVIS